MVCLYILLERLIVKSLFVVGGGGDGDGRPHKWRMEQQPTPVFLPGEFHEQRSLTGYRPWGHKKSDTTND